MVFRLIAASADALVDQIPGDTLNTRVFFREVDHLFAKLTLIIHWILKSRW